MNIGSLVECCECGNPKVENKDLGLCSSCNTARRKRDRLSKVEKPKRKALPKFSKKRKEENPIYSERRLIFLDGKKCAVFPNLDAVQVHHRKGRQGYADNWARDNKVSLHLDERWWLPVSEEGHKYIGDHPAESFEKGWSLSRLENLDQEPMII